MGLPQGVNFRATSGFVTDGANETFELGTNSGSPTYPHTTPQGINIGFEVSSTSNADRSSSIDRRLAGIIFTPIIGLAFRVDLPASGSHNVRIAAGDFSSGNQAAWDLYDNTTLLSHLTSGTPGTGNFFDAQNVAYSAANWPASNTAKAFTFSSTTLRLKSAQTTSNTVLAHFYVESAAAVNITGTLASTMAGVTLASSGTALNAGSIASTLGGVTMAASGAATLQPSGAIASTLAGFTMAAAGTVVQPVTGTFASTLAGVTMAASGISGSNATGTIASTLAGVTMLAVGQSATPIVSQGSIGRRRSRPRTVPRTN